MKLSKLVVPGPSSIHGTGLFARVAIARGTYIGTYRGPTAKRNGMYVLWITDEDGVSVGRRGLNQLRYLNHRRPPNTEFDGFDLHARRAIRSGEELTIDYQWDEE